MNSVELSAVCLTCRTWHHTAVELDRIERYMAGDEYVQDVWPEYDTWNREIILGWKTGVFMCQECCEDAERDLVKEADDASGI